MDEILCNGSELDKEVRAKIGPGWWVADDSGRWFQVAGTRGYSGGRLMVLIVNPAASYHDMPVVTGREIQRVTAAHPPAELADVSLTTAYRFGLPGTVTREDARKMYLGALVKKWQFRDGGAMHCGQPYQVASHLETFGGNVQKITDATNKEGEE